MLLLVPLVACGTPHFTSESGQLAVEAPGLVDLETGGADNPVLAGTSFVPALRVAGGDPTDVGPCFEDTFEGPIAGDRGGVTFTEAGTAIWTFTAVACSVADFSPVDDRLVVEVVGAEDVEGALVAVMEEAAEEFVADGTARGTFPDGWVPAPGEPWRVVAGTPVAVHPRLRTVDGGWPVAWQADGAAIVAEPVVGDAPDVAFESGAATTLASAGAEAALRLEVAGASFDVGTVVGVDPGAAASVEIAVLYAVTAEGDAPAAARAVVKDADGNPLFGAPVAWSVDGDLTFSSMGEGLPDYTWVEDDCLAPSESYGERTATLHAKVGDLSASLPLTWTPRAAPGEDGDFAPDEACFAEEAPKTGEDTGGCGCTSPTGAPGAIATMLGALALARRRRR